MLFWYFGVLSGASAYEWSEIIRSARARLQYNESLLKLDSATDTGLQSVFKNFPQLKTYLDTDTIQ